jgi:bilirubin oxidase
MVFDVEGSAAPPIHVPDTLSSLPPPPDTTGWKAREVRLSMGADGEWLINGLNFRSHGHHPAFEVKRGSREVWDIRNNMTSMPHPIHIHGVQFRVVSRSISPPDIRARQVADGGLGPQDLGFNDTVLVWPGEIVRVAIDFSQPFSGTQRYMLHCHNLEHEDMGMMLTFAVVD